MVAAEQRALNASVRASAYWNDFKYSSNRASLAALVGLTTTLLASLGIPRLKYARVPPHKGCLASSLERSLVFLERRHSRPELIPTASWLFWGDVATLK